MVTVIERPINTEIDQRHRLLSERVEQDIVGVLTEFGARMEKADPAPARRIPPPTMAYGVPMAGVRYYTYVPEEG